MPMNKIFMIAAGAAALAAAAGIAWSRYRQLQASEQETAETDRETLLEGLARHAPLYDGLYEGIYQAAHQDNMVSRDAIREFCGRTAGLEEDAAFAQTFAARFDGSADAEPAAYREKMAELLELLQAAGITRAAETELALSPKVRREYIFLGEPVPADGAVCRVMKPRWICQDRLVEQGILMAKEDAQ